MAHKGSALLTAVGRERSYSGSESSPRSPRYPVVSRSRSETESTASSVTKNNEETQETALQDPDRWDIVADDETNMAHSNEPFSARIAGLVNHEDVESVLELQSNMLSRFEKANAQMDRFNELSANRFQETQELFRNYTRLLSRMKRDLNSVFRRIKDLKQKLDGQLPVEAMRAAALERDREKDDTNSEDNEQ